MSAERIASRLKAEPELLSATDAHGNTLLHKAVERREVGLIKKLLSLGSNVNRPNKYGQTALHVACETRATDIARLLIDKGADVNRANSKGVTPLTVAVSSCAVEHVGCEPETNIRCRDLSIITLLLSRGAKVNGDPLHAAVAGMDDRVVQLIVHAGANLEESYDGQTALCYAVDDALPGSCCGYHTKLFVPVIKTLLSAGADVNSVDTHQYNDKQTVLHHAVLLADTKADSAFRAILATPGINVNARDEDGQTALHVAASIGRISAIRALLKAGADVTIRDKNRDLPYNLALMNRYSDAAALLEF